MDRKPAAKPPGATPRPPATPAVTRTQTVDVRASKARAQEYKASLSVNARSVVTRNPPAEGATARRHSAAAAASEAAAAQRHRAENMASRGARQSRAELADKSETGSNARSTDSETGKSARGARPPAPQSPGRAPYDQTTLHFYGSTIESPISPPPAMPPTRHGVEAPRLGAY